MEKSSFLDLIPLEVWAIITHHLDWKSFCKILQCCSQFLLLGKSMNESFLKSAIEARANGSYRLAKRCLLKAASCGNSNAMVLLAFEYRTGGFGLKCNDKRGSFWAERAAMEKNPNGMALFARLLKEGLGISKNEAEALVWAKKAFECNEDFAVGYCFFWGLGVEENVEKAFCYWKRAGCEGNEIAQFNVGILYFCGQGVTVDHQMAFNWHMKAAIQGSAVAQNAVGAHYRVGMGAVQDKQKSCEWFLKGATQGSVNAQFNLAAHLEREEKNIEMAVLWYKKAANQGSEGAIESLKRLGY